MAHNDFRPTTPRQRRYLIGGAAATVLGFWLLMLYEPGRDPDRWPLRPGPCAKGQTEGCVGGTAQVRLIAAPVAAPVAAPGVGERTAQSASGAASGLSAAPGR